MICALYCMHVIFQHQVKKPLFAFFPFSLLPSLLKVPKTVLPKASQLLNFNGHLESWLHPEMGNTPLSSNSLFLCFKILLYLRSGSSVGNSFTLIMGLLFLCPSLQSWWVLNPALKPSPLLHTRAIPLKSKALNPTLRFWCPNQHSQPGPLPKP